MEFSFCRREEEGNPTVGPGTQSWQKDDDLLALAENRILLTLLEHGANPSAKAVEFHENERWEMPVWLRFFITIRRVHLLKQPKVYEETLFAMLDGFETLENVTVARVSLTKTNGESSVQEKFNFWDVCQSWANFSLPTMTGLCGDEFLTRVFARVLAKIPAENESFRKAEAWCKTVLLASADELESAVTFLRSGAHLRISEKRGAVEEQESPRNTKRTRERRRQKQ